MSQSIICRRCQRDLLFQFYNKWEWGQNPSTSPETKVCFVIEICNHDKYVDQTNQFIMYKVKRQIPKVQCNRYKLDQNWSPSLSYF